MIEKNVTLTCSGSEINDFIIIIIKLKFPPAKYCRRLKTTMCQFEDLSKNPLGHNVPAWGHSKISDLAETLPNEYFYPLLERTEKFFFSKYELWKKILMVEVGWFDREISSFILFYLVLSNDISCWGRDHTSDV